MNLKELEVPKGITNGGLQQLAALTQLEDLAIGGSEVDDDGVVYLKGMKKLQHIYISQLHLSDAAIKQLRADHPGLRIDFQPERPKREGNNPESAEAN